MSYRRLRVHRDANHWPVVRALEALGIVILDTSPLGDDAPDIICAGGPLLTTGVWACEIKNPENQGGARGTSPGQRAWLRRWPGPSTVLWGVDDAIAWATGRQRPDPPRRAEHGQSRTESASADGACGGERPRAGPRRRPRD
jgi:hypothetical protein